MNWQVTTALFGVALVLSHLGHWLYRRERGKADRKLYADIEVETSKWKGTWTKLFNELKSSIHALEKSEADAINTNARIAATVAYCWGAGRSSAELAELRSIGLEKVAELLKMPFNRDGAPHFEAWLQQKQITEQLTKRSPAEIAAKYLEAIRS